MAAKVGIESIHASNMIDKAEMSDSVEDDEEPVVEVEEEASREKLSGQDQSNLTELRLFIGEALHLPRLSSPW